MELRPSADPILKEIAEEIAEEDGRLEVLGMADALPRVEMVQDHLANICTSPKINSLGALVAPLRRLMNEESEAARGRIASTQTVRAVFDTLDRCASLGARVLMEGPSRTGKTTAARAWCETSCGLGRYIKTPPGNDQTSFFRAIATALGSADGTGYRANQMEDRIKLAVVKSGLVLVFDDAWQLWPQGDVRQSHPVRMNWLAGLMDAGVSVALVTSPQWWDSHRSYIAQTGWAVDQFAGRISEIVELPAQLDEVDGVAVAASMLPHAGAKIWEALGCLAVASRRRLGALEAAVTEVLHVARMAGREVPTLADLGPIVERAMRTDSRLAAASDRPPADSGSRGATPPPRRGGSAAETPRSERFSERTGLGLRGVDSPIQTARIA